MIQCYMQESIKNERLLKAAASGRWCHLLLESSRHLNLVCKTSGDTLLHLAAQQGNGTAVKHILNHQPHLVTVRNLNGKTALHEASQHCHLECIKLLIECDGCDINTLKRSDWTALMLSCANTNNTTDDVADVVKFLCANGARVDLRNKDGWSALHLACRRRDGAELVSLLLLSEKYSTSSTVLRTNNGRTPLHIAALHRNLTTIRVLLQYFQLCDLFVRDKCGNTPLHEAILGGDIQCFEYLVEIVSTSDIYQGNSTGYTLLHLASCQGYDQLVRLLITKYQFNVDCVDLNGCTPLHCAGRLKRVATYNLLVEFGADSRRLDKFDRTPKHYLDNNK